MQLICGCVAVNADECLMTRMQEMSLDYHFIVEQEVGSSTYAFFGFNGKPTIHMHVPQSLISVWKKKMMMMICNYVLLLCAKAGTAGVWRLSALNEAGGWKDRTTVEDMDLAVRAGLKGWKFLYLGDLKVTLILSCIESFRLISSNKDK